LFFWESVFLATNQTCKATGPMIAVINSLKKNWIILIILICISSSAVPQTSAQSFFSSLHLETKIHSAFIIPHHNELWQLTDGFFPSYEVSLVRQTIGKNYYTYLRKHPRIGITYRYSDFGGSPYLGTSHSLMPFISLQVLRERNFLLDFRVALGVGYLTKTYHHTENFRNIAISTHYNASVYFQLQAKWQLSTVTDFTTGLSMLHLSNGTLKIPNYGLNIPGVFAGFYFKLNRERINYQQPDTLIFKKGHRNFRIFAGMAQKEVIDHWEEKFLVYTAEIAFTQYYSNTNRYLIGIDVTCDNSNIKALESQDGSKSDLALLTKVGLVAGHEWVFSNFTMTFSIGHYLYNKNQSDKLIYNKIGLSYYFTKNIYSGLILKSHYAKADFLSAGVGLNF
jgi:hypothetical protein